MKMSSYLPAEEKEDVRRGKGVGHGSWDKDAAMKPLGAALMLLKASQAVSMLLDASWSDADAQRMSDIDA